MKSNALKDHSSPDSNSLSKINVLETKGKIQINNPTTVTTANIKPRIARNPPVTSPS